MLLSIVHTVIIKSDVEVNDVTSCLPSNYYPPSFQLFCLVVCFASLAAPQLADFNDLFRLASLGGNR